MKARLIDLFLTGVLWLSAAALANLAGLWLASIVDTIQKL